MNSYSHLTSDVLTSKGQWLRGGSPLLQKTCKMMIKDKKTTPISNIKGSLFCSRMGGKPSRMKQIPEKCLFYRYTDRHGARTQRKRREEQSYSEHSEQRLVQTDPGSAQRCRPSHSTTALRRRLKKNVKNPEGGNHPIDRANGEVGPIRRVRQRGQSFKNGFLCVSVCEGTSVPFAWFVSLPSRTAGSWTPETSPLRST